MKFFVFNLFFPTIFIYLLKRCDFLRLFKFFYIINFIFWEDYIILFSHVYGNYIIRLWAFFVTKIKMTID